MAPTTTRVRRDNFIITLDGDFYPTAASDASDSDDGYISAEDLSSSHGADMTMMVDDSFNIAQEEESTENSDSDYDATTESDSESEREREEAIGIASVGAFERMITDSRRRFLLQHFVAELAAERDGIQFMQRATASERGEWMMTTYATIEHPAFLETYSDDIAYDLCCIEIFLAVGTCTLLEAIETFAEYDDISASIAALRRTHPPPVLDSARQ